MTTGVATRNTMPAPQPEDHTGLVVDHIQRAMGYLRVANQIDDDAADSLIFTGVCTVLAGLVQKLVPQASVIPPPPE